MSSWRSDLTIDQLLNDPVTIAVMKADRVNPDSLRAMLRGQAERLNALPRRPTAPSFPFPGNPTFSGAGSPFDCCRAP